jgi:hypothetical protein
MHLYLVYQTLNIIFCVVVHVVDEVQCMGLMTCRWLYYIECHACHKKNLLGTWQNLKALWHKVILWMKLWACNKAKWRILITAQPPRPPSLGCWGGLDDKFGVATRKYSLRFKTNVTFGHQLCYKIKVTFGEISLKPRQTNWNVVRSNLNVVVDELSSQITVYTCLTIDIWTQRRRRTSTRFNALRCCPPKMAGFQSNWHQ